MNSPPLYRKVLKRLHKEQYLKTAFYSSRPFRIGRLCVVFWIVLWISRLQLPIICVTQEPITWSEQLLCSRVTAFLITSLFLEQFWREFWAPYKSHKPDRKTYRPEKGLLRKLWNEVNCFPVSHKVNVIHIHGITQNEEGMKYVELITH